MIRNKIRLLSGLLAVLMLSTMADNGKAEVMFRFDYTYDTDGFFDPGTSEGQARRAVMEQAASYLRFSDTLAAITPGEGNTWSGTITHPSLLGQVTVENLAIAENEIVIFAGGRYIPVDGVLGFANAATNITASGSTSFLEAIETRGQAGMAAATPTDFAPAFASITYFHTESWSWHAGPTTAGLDGTKSDLLTTTIHEIGHLLGIGEAPSWYAQLLSNTEGDFFTGAASMASYGGPVPVDQYGAHFAEGVASHIHGLSQETLMDPSTSRGVRQLPTELDYAALSDIGWQVVPEPSSWALSAWGLLAGGLWMFTGRSRRAGHAQLDR